MLNINATNYNIHMQEQVQSNTVEKKEGMGEHKSFIEDVRSHVDKLSTFGQFAIGGGLLTAGEIANAIINKNNPGEAATALISYLSVLTALKYEASIDEAIERY